LVVVEVTLGPSATSSGRRPACGPTVTDTPPVDPNAEPDRPLGRVVRASATLNMTMRDLTTRQLVMRGSTASGVGVGAPRIRNGGCLVSMALGRSAGLLNCWTCLPAPRQRPQRWTRPQ